MSRIICNNCGELIDENLVQCPYCKILFYDINTEDTVQNLNKIGLRIKEKDKIMSCVIKPETITLTQKSIISQICHKHTEKDKLLSFPTSIIAKIEAEFDVISSDNNTLFTITTNNEN